MAILDSRGDTLKYEIQEEPSQGARIKVIGVGGGGANAVARMVKMGLQGVEFYILNTDTQALKATEVPNKVQIGSKITNGLGAGSDPSIGRQAALEDTDRICEILEGTDMVFVTAGLGGGTGTGAAPVVASLAKELGALTVAVVTKPFAFEGPMRMKRADTGLAELAGTVDTVIAIPNDRLLGLVPKGTSLPESFRIADDILFQAVQGMSDIMTTPGLINRDFSDIKATMSGMGYAAMGTATASGENAASEAARAAINCPLLEDSRIKGSRGVLINITGSEKVGLHEVAEACNIVREAAACEDVQITWGITTLESMGDKVKVTVIATGFQPDNSPAPLRGLSPARELDGFRSSEPAFSEPPPPQAPEVDLPLPPPASSRPLMTEPGYDADDLDVPAYLRQGKLLN